ncbi:hypothetical protein A2686_01275 [Candidatus Woesebacteria bacterium RIFCSPHIGHO2_01_FULL_38_10]|uniref:RNase H type-1 domain-containing protein n=1 Tax=Candidatus Woesebacteria bacterium RIFCSPLOWO2_01_FULL_39_10b TaxID=1802517 RepID=A0A1F8B8J1_9BACT|nr:MAG: hypothetical protein A2686_01275 [Candidatus Woesebacteria bacterium RIFCSPHIGHO2_01_FULL_38_10]OGM60366.1 MAG: hypothetical protein A2892_03315 [Candidatus Woesebacteria bacterium RIFCSPLOWO2_01_FULL_39_10b]
MDRHIKIYTDGGARGNPGPAAGAFVLIDGGRVFLSETKYLGIRTNNEAEYSALLLASQWLKKNKEKFFSQKTKVDFFLDSELVVRQMNGLYRVKSKSLKFLVRKIKSHLESIEGVTFNFISREKNKLADKLVNQEINENL